MQIEYREISVKGRNQKVPAVTIGDQTVVVSGGSLKTARLHEAEWFEGQVVKDAPALVSELKRGPLAADILTFCQDLGDPEPRLSYPYEWEDVAAVPITTFTEWWEQLPQESRKNVRRAEKRGVTVKIAQFDDNLVAGIKAIYDEAPFRQGRQFWHYGKDLASVRRDNSSFLERADFICAYHGEELIGFIKIVYVGKYGRIMQILSKNAHADKKTPNILLSKAMEACCARGMTHFIYGQYFYSNKGHTPITEFKRRNGFQQFKFPRYFVPLTVKGRVAMALRLHLGVSNLLPPRLKNYLLEIRSKINRRKTAEDPEPAGKQA